MAGSRQLTVRRMRTVAENHFGDAVALCKTSDNARATGVMYLAGLAVDCLLKAKLLEKYTYLARRPDSATLTAQDKIRLRLIYGWHDPGQALEHLPDMVAKIGAR